MKARQAKKILMTTLTSVNRKTGETTYMAEFHGAPMIERALRRLGGAPSFLFGKWGAFRWANRQMLAAFDTYQMATWAKGRPGS